MKRITDYELSEYCAKHDIKNLPGIYVFHREENGFKFAYVGQSIHCAQRVFEHIHGYTQHIDLSLKSHGLYSALNPTGYKIEVIEYVDNIDTLDELEMKYCRQYANEGYQLRNTTSGSQGKGKFNLSENKSSKGYREGVRDGYKKAQKYLQTLFSKGYIGVSIQGNTNTYKQRALQKFREFLSNQQEDDFTVNS